MFEDLNTMSTNVGKDFDISPNIQIQSDHPKVFARRQMQTEPQPGHYHWLRDMDNITESYICNKHVSNYMNYTII